MEKHAVSLKGSGKGDRTLAGCLSGETAAAASWAFDASGSQVFGAINSKVV